MHHSDILLGFRASGLGLKGLRDVQDLNGQTSLPHAFCKCLPGLRLTETHVLPGQCDTAPLKSNGTDNPTSGSVLTGAGVAQEGESQ